MKTINGTPDIISKNKVDIYLRSFKNIKPGWCFGEGVAFDPVIIDLARKVNAVAVERGMLTSASPGRGGDIIISIHHKQNECLEVWIFTDGTADLTNECEHESINCGDSVSIEAAIGKIEELRIPSWMSRDRYISGISTSKPGDSDPTLSWKEMASLAAEESAFTTAENLSVSTLNFMVQKREHSPSFTWRSPQTNSLYPMM